MFVKGGINRREKLRSKAATTKANAKVENKKSKSNVKLTKVNLRKDIMLGRGDGDCLDGLEPITNEQRKSNRIIKIIDDSKTKEVINAHSKNIPKKVKNNSNDKRVEEISKCSSNKKDDVKDVIMIDEANNSAGLVSSTDIRYSKVAVDNHVIKKHVTSIDRLTGLTQTPNDTSGKTKIDIRKSMSFLEMMDYLTTPESGDESDIDVLQKRKTEEKSQSSPKLKNKGSINPFPGNLEEIIATRGKSNSPTKKQQSPNKSTKEIIPRLNNPEEGKGNKIEDVMEKEIERRLPTTKKKKETPSKSTKEILVLSNSPGKKEVRKTSVEKAKKLSEDEKDSRTPSKKQQSPSKSAKEKMLRLKNPGEMNGGKSLEEEEELLESDRKTEKSTKKQQSPSKSTKEILVASYSPMKKEDRKTSVKNAKKLSDDEKRTNSPSKKPQSPSKSAKDKKSRIKNPGEIDEVKSVEEEESDRKTEKCARKQQSPTKSVKEILPESNSPAKRDGRTTAVKDANKIIKDERVKKQSPSKSAKGKSINPGEISLRKSADDDEEKELTGIKEKTEKCTKKQSPPKSVIKTVSESKSPGEIRSRISAVRKTEEVIKNGSKESPINESIAHTTTKRTSTLKSASEIITENKRVRKSAFTKADDETVYTPSNKSPSEITSELNNSVEKEDESTKDRRITQTSSQENTTTEIRARKSVHNKPAPSKKLTFESPKIPGFALIEEIRSRKSAFPTKMTSNDSVLQRSSPYKRPMSSLCIDEPRTKVPRLETQAVSFNKVKEVRQINGDSFDSSILENTADLTNLERKLKESIENTKQELIKKRLAAGTEQRASIIFTRGMTSMVAKSEERSKTGALKKNYRIKLRETKDVTEETENGESLSKDEENTMETAEEGVKKGWCSVM